VQLDDDAPDPPRLTDETVEDDALLAEAIDALLAQDPTAQERIAEIAMHHAWFSDMVDPGTWSAFLQLEELSSARAGDDLVAVARWAFHEGQACRGTST
jgi:hypothetical protein